MPTNRNALWLALLPLLGHAAAIVVDDAGDDGGGGCQLRDAIRSANANASRGGCVAGEGADLVRFDLTFPATISLYQPLPTLASAITIEGPGMDQLAIDLAAAAPNASWIVDADHDTVTLAGLTIRNGVSVEGGAILNRSLVTLQGVRLEGNSATGLQGGGGGLLNDGGTAILRDVELIGNTGNVGAGAHSRGGTLAVTGALIEANRYLSQYYAGAGIDGTEGAALTIEDSTFTRNAPGLGLLDSSADLSGVRFDRNLATEYGLAGGMDVIRSTVTGFDLVFERNHGSIYGQGGAIYVLGGELELKRSTISTNGASDGGGIAVSRGSTARITQTRMTGNSARGVVFGPYRGFGGALLASGDSVVRIEDSTLDANDGLDGGALEIRDASLTLSNVTISGNEGVSAVRVSGESSLTARHMTLVNSLRYDDPYSPGRAGGVGLDATAPVTLSGSTIADNAGADCRVTGEAVLQVEGSNHFGDEHCDGVARGDLQLGELAQNGGQTPTHRPAASSALLGAGDASFCPIRDQRGEARAVECDIGAVERGGTLRVLASGFERDLSATD